MAKFDVHQVSGERSLVIDCQVDLLADLSTRFVVPLLPENEAPTAAARLNPMFTIAGERFVMVTQLAAAVPRSALGERLASLGDDDFLIGDALDMLITGF